MRILKGFIFSLLIVYFAKSFELAVIANKDFNADNISLHLLKRIYLKKKLFINGNKVIPVNLKYSSKLRKIFQKEVLNMDEEELSLYWNNMYFNGIRPPLTLSSERAVIEFVKKFKNAIGYVSYGNVKNSKNIKIIKIIKVNKDGK